MGQIVRFSGSETAIQHALARQISNVQLVALVAKTGIGQIGYTHRYAQAMVAQTLHAAQAIVNVNSGVTPEQQAAIQQLTQLYLDHMLRLAEEAGTEMIALFRR